MAGVTRPATRHPGEGRGLGGNRRDLAPSPGGEGWGEGFRRLESMLRTPSPNPLPMGEG
jgi:hypothetical protein